MHLDFGNTKFLNTKNCMDAKALERDGYLCTVKLPVDTTEHVYDMFSTGGEYIHI